MRRASRSLPAPSRSAVDELTALLLRAADGDRSATEQFIRATMGDVTRYCTHLVGRQRADDAVQATFLRVLRSLGGFRAESTAHAWLIGVARNTCVDLLRSDHRQARLQRRAQAMAVRSPDPGPDDGGLEELVGGLPVPLRDAFALTQVLGLSYAEAADVLGCPVGTVRSRVSRARQHLAPAVRPVPDASPISGPSGHGQRLAFSADAVPATDPAGGVWT